MLPNTDKIEAIRELLAQGYQVGKVAKEQKVGSEEIKKIIRTAYISDTDMETLEEDRELTKIATVHCESPLVLEQKEDRESTAVKSSEMTLDDFFNEAIRRQEFKSKASVAHYPEVHHRFKGDKPIAISFLSDLHFGGYGTDYKQLRDDVRTIKGTDGMYVVFNGDEINNFIVGKLQRCSREDVMQPDDQWSFLRLLFAELANKTLAATRGNHTDWTQMLTSVDPRGQICQDLKILDVGHGGKIKVTLGGVLYTVMVRHKFRYESAQNQYNAVVKMYETFGPFDVGVVGHTHVAGIATFSRQDKDFVAVRPGSYKVRDDFAEELGYNAAKPVSPTVILFPGSKRILTFQNCEDAASYLKVVRT